MTQTIFTHIINGDIPSHHIYDDETTYSFLDIHPIQPGMTLVVTRQPVASIYDLDDETYAALWRSVAVVAQKLRRAFPDKARIGIQVEGLDVPHVHVKLIPIDSGEEFRALPDMAVAPDHAALAATAAHIKTS
jgi:histidine triad (HIT) family protein